MIYLHLKAKNDTNGKAVGAFLVIYTNGEIMDVIKEYEDGDHVQAKYPGIHKGPTIKTTSTVINAFLKNYSKQ